MNTQTINDITITTNDDGNVTALNHQNEYIAFDLESVVVVSVRGRNFKVGHTYNDDQSLMLPIGPDAIPALIQYTKDPMTAYRVVVQSDHDVLKKGRNLFSSFVMYGSQGLSNEIQERLNLTYRVVVSLFDTSIIDAVAKDEQKELSLLAGGAKLRNLIKRLLELHFGFITKPEVPVDLLDAPIVNVISGRAPDSLTIWARDNGLITEEQAKRVLGE